MANLGIGLGAFMGGLSQGINTYRSLRQMKEQADLHEAKMGEFKEAKANRDALKAAHRDAYEQAKTQRDNKVGALVDMGMSKDEAEAEAGSLMESYRQKFAPRVVESYLQQGDTEGAAKFQAFLDSDEARAGMRAWDQLGTAAMRRDNEGVAAALKAMGRAKGYMGGDWDINDVKPVYGENDQFEGFDIIFTGKDGKQQVEQMRGGEDLYQMGLQALSPHARFEALRQDVQTADKARTELAKEDRSLLREMGKEGRRLQYQLAQERRANQESDRRQQLQHSLQMERANNQSLLRAAEQESRQQQPSTRQPTTRDVERDIQTIIRDRQAADPRFARLSFEEQLEQARRIYQQRQSTAEELRNQPASDSAPLRSTRSAITLY